MKRMQGFSLVELMVSMVLGLLITGAALQLLLANQQSFALQQTLSRVQENGQLFVRFLVTDLRRAGLEMANVASTDAQGVRFTASGNIPGSNNGNDYDRLTLSYHGVTDCEGSIAPAMTEVVNTYFVNDDSELLCQGGLTGGNGVVLLEDVEAFEVLYGIDEERDGTAKVNRYVEAGLQGGTRFWRFAFLCCLKRKATHCQKATETKSFLFSPKR